MSTPTPSRADAAPSAAPRRRTGESIVRASLLVAGVCGAVIGIRALLPVLRAPQDVATFLAWAVVPPVVVDALIVPFALLLGWGVRRALPQWARAPVATALILSGALVAVALPFLGAPGRRPDNDSLLNRNYVAGLAVYLAAVWLGTAAWLVVRRRREPTGPANDGEH